MSDISIIIISWNAKNFLSECLESVRHGTRSLVAETIVVDNASTDQSVEFVRDRFPEVRLICNETNLGFAKANNIGLRASVGKYLFLLNSDIKVLDDCFKKMIEYMDEHPEIGMLGPQILRSDLTPQRSCMSFPTLWNSFSRALALDKLFPNSRWFGGFLMTNFSHEAVRAVDIINGCFWMVRRAALDQVGLLDETFFIYGEDMDWCRRFWRAGWEIVFYPEAQAIHYGGASSSNAPIRFYLEMKRATWMYIRKYHGRLFQILYAIILLLHEILRMAGHGMRYFIQPANRNQSKFKFKRSATAVLRFHEVLSSSPITQSQ